MSSLDAWKIKGCSVKNLGHTLVRKQRSFNLQPVAGPLAGPQAKPSHLLVSWIWQSKVWASLWSPPPARVVWPLRPLAEVGAPASGAASGMAGSSPAGGPGHAGTSLPPPSVYNETVGETVQGQSKREWDGVMVVALTRSPHPLG